MSHDDASDVPARQTESADQAGETLDDQQEFDRLSRERREALQDFWIAVKRIPAYARLAAAMTKDSAVPHRARAVLLAGGAYLVSPIDLVPGVIPVAGQLDDLYVLLMSLRQALRMSPQDAADRHLESLNLTHAILDEDLAAIRRLVRVGVATGARWGWRRLGAARARLSEAIANRRRGEE